MLTTISSYYLAKAIKLTDETLREELFTEVRIYFGKSDKIDINEKSTFVVKGFYYFYRNEIKQSIIDFENAKDTDPNYMPYIIGRACVEFAKKKYADALVFFKAALRLNPTGPYQMRLGLAH